MSLSARARAHICSTTTKRMDPFQLHFIVISCVYYVVVVIFLISLACQLPLLSLVFREEDPLFSVSLTFGRSFGSFDFTCTWHCVKCLRCYSKAIMYLAHLIVVVATAVVMDSCKLLAIRLLNIQCEREYK